MESLSEMKEKLFITSQENIKTCHFNKKYKTKRICDKKNFYYRNNRSLTYKNTHSNSMSFNYNSFNNTLSKDNFSLKDIKEIKSKDKNNKISLKFTIIDNENKENEKIISCYKNDLFSDVIDKLLNNKIIENKEQIKGFSIKNKEKSFIDIDKTVASNGLEDNSQIIINMKP